MERRKQQRRWREKQRLELQQDAIMLLIAQRDGFIVKIDKSIEELNDLKYKYRVDGTDKVEDIKMRKEWVSEYRELVQNQIPDALHTYRTAAAAKTESAKAKSNIKPAAAAAAAARTNDAAARAKLTEQIARLKTHHLYTSPIYKLRREHREGIAKRKAELALLAAAAAAASSQRSSKKDALDQLMGGGSLLKDDKKDEDAKKRDEAEEEQLLPIDLETHLLRELEMRTSVTSADGVRMGDVIQDFKHAWAIETTERKLATSASQFKSIHKPIVSRLLAAINADDRIRIATYEARLDAFQDQQRIYIPVEAVKSSERRRRNQFQFRSLEEIEQNPAAYKRLDFAGFLLQQQMMSDNVKKSLPRAEQISQYELHLKIDYPGQFKIYVGNQKGDPVPAAVLETSESARIANLNESVIRRVTELSAKHARFLRSTGSDHVRDIVELDRAIRDFSEFKAQLSLDQSAKRRYIVDVAGWSAQLVQSSAIPDTDEDGPLLEEIQSPEELEDAMLYVKKLKANRGLNDKLPDQRIAAVSESVFKGDLDVAMNSELVGGDGKDLNVLGVTKSLFVRFPNIQFGGQKMQDLIGTEINLQKNQNIIQSLAIKYGGSADRLQQRLQNYETNRRRRRIRVAAALSLLWDSLQLYRVFAPSSFTTTGEAPSGAFELVYKHDLAVIINPNDRNARPELPVSWPDAVTMTIRTTSGGGGGGGSKKQKLTDAAAAHKVAKNLFQRDRISICADMGRSSAATYSTMRRDTEEWLMNALSRAIQSKFEPPGGAYGPTFPLGAAAAAAAIVDESEEGEEEEDSPETRRKKQKSYDLKLLILQAHVNSILDCVDDILTNYFGDNSRALARRDAARIFRCRLEAIQPLFYAAAFRLAWSTRANQGFDLEGKGTYISTVTDKEVKLKGLQLSILKRAVDDYSKRVICSEGCSTYAITAVQTAILGTLQFELCLSIDDPSVAVADPDHPGQTIRKTIEDVFLDAIDEDDSVDREWVAELKRFAAERRLNSSEMQARRTLRALADTRRRRRRRSLTADEKEQRTLALTTLRRAVFDRDLLTLQTMREYVAGKLAKLEETEEEETRAQQAARLSKIDEAIASKDRSKLAIGRVVYDPPPETETEKEKEKEKEKRLAILRQRRTAAENELQSLQDEQERIRADGDMDMADIDASIESHQEIIAEINDEINDESDGTAIVAGEGGGGIRGQILMQQKVRGFTPQQSFRIEFSFKPKEREMYNREYLKRHFRGRSGQGANVTVTPTRGGGSTFSVQRGNGEPFTSPGVLGSNVVMINSVMGDRPELHPSVCEEGAAVGSLCNVEDYSTEEYNDDGPPSFWQSPGSCHIDRVCRPLPTECLALAEGQPCNLLNQFGRCHRGTCTTQMGLTRLFGTLVQYGMQEVAERFFRQYLLPAFLRERAILLGLTEEDLNTPHDRDKSVDSRLAVMSQLVIENLNVNAQAEIEIRDRVNAAMRDINIEFGKIVKQKLQEEYDSRHSALELRKQISGVSIIPADAADVAAAASIVSIEVMDVDGADSGARKRKRRSNGASDVLVADAVAAAAAAAQSSARSSSSNADASFLTIVESIYPKRSRLTQENVELLNSKWEAWVGPQSKHAHITKIMVRLLGLEEEEELPLSTNQLGEIHNLQVKCMLWLIQNPNNNIFGEYDRLSWWFDVLNPEEVQYVILRNEAGTLSQSHFMRLLQEMDAQNVEALIQSKVLDNNLLAQSDEFSKAYMEHVDNIIDDVADDVDDEYDYKDLLDQLLQVLSVEQRTELKGKFL